MNYYRYDYVCLTGIAEKCVDKEILGIQSARHEKYHKIFYSAVKHTGRYASTNAYDECMCKCPYLRRVASTDILMPLSNLEIKLITESGSKIPS
jgi:hypothetical protein